MADCRLLRDGRFPKKHRDRDAMKGCVARLRDDHLNYHRPVSLRCFRTPAVSSLSGDPGIRCDLRTLRSRRRMAAFPERRRATDRHRLDRPFKFCLFLGHRFQARSARLVSETQAVGCWESRIGGARTSCGAGNRRPTSQARQIHRERWTTTPGMATTLDGHRRRATDGSIDAYS